MSSVPNLPENVSRDNQNNADDALRHSLFSREAVKRDAQEQIDQDHKLNGTHVNGNHAQEPWMLHDTPIENLRPLKVIVIGAGYSGIYLGIRIPERLRNCELVIYEKNAGIGGTWSVASIKDSVYLPG